MIKKNPNALVSYMKQIKCSSRVTAPNKRKWRNAFEPNWAFSMVQGDPWRGLWPSLTFLLPCCWPSGHPTTTIACTTCSVIAWWRIPLNRVEMWWVVFSCLMLPNSELHHCRRDSFRSLNRTTMDWNNPTLISTFPFSLLDFWNEFHNWCLCD